MPYRWRDGPRAGGDPARGWRRRAWREWCFARAALRHFRARFLVMLFVLVTGALLFERAGSEHEFSLYRGVFNTWRLILGELPDGFPDSKVLDALCFIVPILGLTLIVEGIVDFTWLLRDRRRYERSWCLMMASSLKDHIVLVGLGKVGFRTYNLLRSLGERIVVVERDADNPFLDVVREHGEPLLVGDGRRDQLLQDAGIESAKSVIVATDDDLANLEIALDARRFHPGIRVILRMFDQGMADKIREGFDIHLAMSVSAISAPNFAMAAIDPKIESSFVMDDRLIVMLRWIAHEGGPLCHKTIGDIQAELGFGVAQLTPAGGESKLFPPSETRLGPGDELLVQGPYDDLVALKKRDVDLTAGSRT